MLRLQFPVHNVPGTGKDSLWTFNWSWCKESLTDTA